MVIQPAGVFVDVKLLPATTPVTSWYSLKNAHVVIVTGVASIGAVTEPNRFGFVH
jgi:hypothetical protein